MKAVITIKTYLNLLCNYLINIVYITCSLLFCFVLLNVFNLCPLDYSRRRSNTQKNACHRPGSNLCQFSSLNYNEVIPQSTLWATPLPLLYRLPLYLLNLGHSKMPSSKLAKFLYKTKILVKKKINDGKSILIFWSQIKFLYTTTPVRNLKCQLIRVIN